MTRDNGLEIEVCQTFPDYDGSQEVVEVEREARRRKPSGKHTLEARAAQQRRWVAKNRAKWNAYQRARYAAKKAVAGVPEWLR